MIPLLALIVLFDGFFHLFSDLKTLEKYSPDWVIMRRFKHKGMPVYIHKLMGIFLIVGSILFMYNKFPLFVYVIYTTIFIITTGLLLKINCDKQVS